MSEIERDHAQIQTRYTILIPQTGHWFMCVAAYVHEA